MIRLKSAWKNGNGFWLMGVAVIAMMHGCKGTEVPPDPVSVQMTAVPDNPRVGQTTILGATPITSGSVPVQGIPCFFSSSNSAILLVTPDGIGARGVGIAVGVVTVAAVCSTGQVRVANTVTITVRPAQVTFMVYKSGTGNGSVFLNPFGGTYDAGTSVTATATALAGSTFDGWGDSCAAFGNQANCTLTLATNEVATATFTLLPPCSTYTYSAWAACRPSNTQSRTVVSSSPPGCGGTPVLSQPCVYVGVVLDTLKVLRVGSGSGNVTSSPAGIDCNGGYGSNTFVNGTYVDLYATPDMGSWFGGWTGACFGTGSCRVLLDSTKTVTAIFTTAPPCTYTYSAWSACRPDSTQSRSVDSTSPPGCVGTPVLMQSCVYTPNTDCCDCNFDVYCTIFGAGGCWYCRNSTIVSGICQAPSGHLTSPGLCVCDPGLYQQCQ